MDNAVAQALEKDRLIDITTTGRKTGKTHRIEIVIHRFDGKLYLNGRPDIKKDWVANLLAAPAFTFHLKQSVQRDILAEAQPVRDKVIRRSILEKVSANFNQQEKIERWVEAAPLFEVKLLIE